MLEKFLRIYTWVVGSLIGVCLLFALWFLFVAGQPYRGYLCLFVAVLAVFILYVTRALGRKNLKKPSERRR